MAAQNYKICAVGPAVGEGATQSIFVGVSGVAKSNLPGPATTVANELVCNRLATAMLLPVPPGFLIQHNGSVHFVSLDFNLAGHSLPPADSAMVVASHHDLCWGITLFDIWIGNWDRHNKNMAHDTTSDRVQIFDHSHALLGNGIAHLQGLGLDTGIGGHCLRTELKTVTGVQKWCDRICAIPEYYVKEIVSDIGEAQFNVSPADAAACSEVLLSRRDKLTEILKTNQTQFPKVPAADWNSI